MVVKPGSRLRSVVCDTEVIVIKAPVGDVLLRCGGQPMELIERDSPASGRRTTSAADPALAGGTQLGKRYVNEGRGLELLCTKAGEGSLTIDCQPLAIRSSEPLPSTD
jgi:hypothetical protein